MLFLYNKKYMNFSSIAEVWKKSITYLSRFFDSDFTCSCLHKCHQSNLKLMNRQLVNPQQRLPNGKFIRITQKVCSKHRLLSPIPRVSDLVSSGVCLRICISNMFPGDPDPANMRTTLGEPLVYTTLPPRLPPSSFSELYS